jgi:uncharacterized membrane protein
MPDQQPPGIRRQLSAWFWRGLLVMIAPVITVWLLELIYKQLNEFLGPLIAFWVRWLVPVHYRGPFVDGNIPGLTLVFSILFLILVGSIASSSLGKKMLHFVLDSIFQRVPGVRSIYAAIRTTVESFADPQKREFKKAVWIPTFGRALGLVIVTKECVDEAGKKILTVWWPHTPNPMSGMIMVVPEEDIIDSGMDYQQTMEVYVSLGVNMPLSLRLTRAAAKGFLSVLPEGKDDKPKEP